jgi:hypothetical protein
MQGQSKTGCRRRGATRLVVLVLTTAAVLVACSPAVALRPRTTPAHAALAARQQGSGTGQAATPHGLTVARILARHEAAAGGAAIALQPRARLTGTHHAMVLGAQGALAVTTLAALAAIILVVAAVIAGERRQVALRRRAEAAARPAQAHGHQVAH